MKLANFKKFPARFTSDEDQAAELLGISGKSEAYTVNDLWLDVYKICAFSKHDMPNCTWVTMDNGMGLALDIKLEDFMEAIKDSVLLDAVEGSGKVLDGEAAFLLDQAAEKTLETLDNEAEDENDQFFTDEDGPQEIDPED